MCLGMVKRLHISSGCHSREGDMTSLFWSLPTSASVDSVALAVHCSADGLLMTSGQHSNTAPHSNHLIIIQAGFKYPECCISSLQPPRSTRLKMCCVIAPFVMNKCFVIVVINRVIICALSCLVTAVSRTCYYSSPLAGYYAQ